MDTAMNRNLWILVTLLVVLMNTACSSGQPENEQQQSGQNAALAAACDWIGGGGSQTVGGSGGTVYIVTTLSDELDENGYMDSGSLRYAVEANGPRTVLFRVAGTIHLTKPLEITNPYITIAGQSAPGDGICIADYPLLVEADEVIVRFLRFRLGSVGAVKRDKEFDAVSVNNSRNVVIDHCSCSWSVDECVSCYGNTNFTMQYCFITESLRNSVHFKGDHGYGGIWGGTNATFHHNLLAHHDSRNPRFDHDYVDSKCRGPLDFVNNVVYNWSSNSAYGGESVNTPRTINFHANYYKPGPATKESVRARLVNPWTSCGNCLSKISGSVVPPQIYMTDNYMYGSETVTADNWLGSTTQEARAASHFSMSTELKAETAEQAFETVLKKGGCSLVRDAIDERIVTEVREGKYTYSGSNGSKNGLIDSPDDVKGWIELTGTPLKDTDLDGMPDDWEEQYGLNPKKASDGKLKTLVDGYTNLDVYLNSLVAHLY